MTVSLADALRQTVTAAAQRLRRLGEAEVAHKPAPDRWSKKEILGHLIDSAANNHQRFVRAQFVDELQSPRYHQEEWVRCQDYQSADWPALVTLWQAYNDHLAHVIAKIPAAKMGTPCRIGDNPPMTLAALIEDYGKHMEHHLRQLDRAGAP
jgi:hypothetical protein